jgi:stage II sporulation protein D
MKQFVLLMLLVILIPYLIFTLLISESHQKFNYEANMTIRVKRVSENKVDVVPFEDYIVGVLAGKMPISFELEALKAQAVASRSYAMKRMEYNQKLDYDVVDTTANQMYLDDTYLRNAWKDKYKAYISKIRIAVISTRTEYMDYDGKVVDAFFFSTSVGKTENVEEVFSASLPYLRSVDSSWDEEVSPVFEEYYHFTLNEFYQALSLSYQAKLSLCRPASGSPARSSNTAARCSCRCILTSGRHGSRSGSIRPRASA